MLLIDLFPLWAVFVLTVIIVMLAIEGGYRLGRLQHLHEKSDHEQPVGAMASVTLSLLAFLLAFTFGYAADRFNDRRLLVIDEASAINTVFLRSEFLPEENRNEVKNLVRKYVLLRLDFGKSVRNTRDPSAFNSAIADTERLQNLMWTQATVIGRSRLDSDVVALFIEALNDTISIQAKSLSAALYARLPDVIWAILYLMTILGMAGLGYQISGSSKRNWPMIAVVVFSFALVIMMIADLDRPVEGFLQVNQEPLINLSRRIGTPTASPNADLKL